MAIVEVKVPQLSESVAEATLLQWKKKVGDAVAVDEILIEVETDKVVMEVPAPSAGVLIELVQADGATVAAEQLIARIDTEARVGAAAPAPAAAVATVTAAPVAAAPAVTGGLKSDVAMPAAAKLLADNNLAVSAVPGTGKDGRVTKGDVLAAVAAGPATKSVAPVAIPTGAPTTFLPQVAVKASAGQPPRAARAHEPLACTRGRASVAIPVH